MIHFSFWGEMIAAQNVDGVSENICVHNNTVLLFFDSVFSSFFVCGRLLCFLPHFIFGLWLLRCVSVFCVFVFLL